MLDALGWAGLVTVEVRRGGEIVRCDRFSNLVVDGALDALSGLLNGSTVDLKLRYMAVGSSATAPAGSDTTLGAEIDRKPLTQLNDAGVGRIQSVTYLAPGDAVGHIRELGWFAGPSATAVADSGVLVARVLYDHQKTALESITVSRTDVIGRA